MVHSALLLPFIFLFVYLDSWGVGEVEKLMICWDLSRRERRG